MSVEAGEIQKGVKVRVKDGRVLTVRGCYLSTSGIVVTAKDGNQIVDQNIPLRDVESIVKEGA